MKTEASWLSGATIRPCDVCGAQLDASHLDPGRNGPLCAFCGAELPPDRPMGELDRDRSPTGLGAILQTAREDRGESLQHVARVTRIREGYLQALEDGEASFEPYPGRIYGRFFVRQYAEHLGLEPEPLVREFDRDAAPAVTPEPPRPLERRVPRPRLWALAAAVVLVGLLAATALIERPDTAPATLPPAGAAIASPGAASTPPPDSPSRPTGIRSVLSITAPSWVRAAVDGRVVIAGKTLPPGRVVRLNGGRRLDLTLGNAGGVRLVVNGERIATGGSGDVVRLSFVWRGGRLVRL